MSSYREINNYKGGLVGTPEFSGIEYDWEVPDNIVVSSPGGVSTTQHHYTKGFYGDGASSWDVYAGEGKRYPYGVHGNLYQTGFDSATELHEYAQYPPDTMYTQNQSTAHIDNFGPVAGMSPTKSGITPVEFIPPPDSAEVKKDLSSDFKKLQNVIKVPNPWFLFIVVLLIYISLDFWVNAGESFIFQKFHGGKTPNYKWLIFYAVLFTFLVFLFTNIVGVPLISLEMNEV
jgi:hypothetical protein